MDNIVRQADFSKSALLTSSWQGFGAHQDSRSLPRGSPKGALSFPQLRLLGGGVPVSRAGASVAYEGHCQTKFYTAYFHTATLRSFTDFAHESSQRSARFEAENRLYSFALTMPARTSAGQSSWPLYPDRLAGDYIRTAPSLALDTCAAYSARIPSL